MLQNVISVTVISVTNAYHFSIYFSKSFLTNINIAKHAGYVAIFLHVLIETLFSWLATIYDYYILFTRK